MNKYWYLNTEKITELPEHAKSQRKYDLPYYDDWPKIKYIICSSPRCGSNLLSEILHAQDGLGVPIAYLHLPAHFPFLAHRWNCLNDNYVDIHKYFKSCFRWRTSKNGVFGMKTHWNHFEYFLKSGILHYYFPNTKFVFLRRQDLLGQAISLELANQTGQWTSKGSSHQKEPASRFQHRFLSTAWPHTNAAMTTMRPQSRPAIQSSSMSALTSMDMWETLRSQ